MRPDVRRWLHHRTFAAETWAAPDLVAVKGTRGCTVSVVLPALDEERTVGAIVSTIRAALVEALPLVDEVVVVDSGSSDRTAEVAREAGADVVAAADVLPSHGDRPGKGEALWKSLAATTGDLVVFLDSDLLGDVSHYVPGLLTPLLTDARVDYVKGCYTRPLTVDGVHRPSGGGRVTELTARPLLNALWPELAGFVQPLGGEYAGRRSAMEQVPFVSSYGVEVGLLLDLLQVCGLAGLAQVDLGTRTHSHQTDQALGTMAGQIVNTLLARAERGRHGRRLEPGGLLTQFRHDGERFVPMSTAVAVDQRPPMATVAEYALLRDAGEGVVG